MTFKEDIQGLNKEQSLDYSPYGGIFWSMDNSEKQSDNWVGKEKDKDKENGLGDHGVRKYDHLIGRFNSIDPLWNRYLTLSPYQYSANSPLTIKDINGKNGVAIVDKENTTITIKAVYLTSFYSSQEIADLNKDINDKLNNRNFSLSSGQYKGYDVVFDLEFMDLFKANGEMRDQDSYNESGINNGNSLKKLADDEGYFKKKNAELKSEGKGAVAGGTTQDNNQIGMPESQNNNANITHEIFHTLFFGNDNSKRGGIGTYNLNKAQNPNQKI